MAKTASTGFSFRKGLNGLEHVGSGNFLLAGSATVKIGDLVRINTSGLLVRCAAGEYPCGVLTGIVDNAGINVFSGRVQSTSIAGATLTPDDQIATASDNATAGAKNLKGQVALDVSGQLLWYNVADGALAQTNVLQFFDVTNGNQVAVGGASDANGEVQLVELDPDNTSAGLFRIAENQFGLGIDTGTAKVAA